MLRFPFENFIGAYIFIYVLFSSEQRKTDVKGLMTYFQSNELQKTTFPLRNFFMFSIRFNRHIKCFSNITFMQVFAAISSIPCKTTDYSLLAQNGWICILTGYLQNTRQEIKFVIAYFQIKKMKSLSISSIVSPRVLSTKNFFSYLFQCLYLLLLTEYLLQFKNC